MTPDLAPVLACKNAMGPTGAQAGAFWLVVGACGAVVIVTGYYLYSRYKA